MRYNLIMSAQRFSSELKEQVVLEVVEKDRTIAEVARSYGLVPQTVGNWVKKWRKDHPESVDSEVGAEQSAENRRLRAELREARMEIDFLKKAASFFAQRVPVTARYAFIHREEGSYPITMMCRCLKVSRSGCYAWLGREPSRTVRRRKELSALIEWVFNSSRGTYGYRRTHAALARRGVETSPDTVRSVMREQGPPGRTATPKGPHHRPGRGPGLAPRPGPAGLHRQQAGSEVGG